MKPVRIHRERGRVQVQPREILGSEIARRCADRAAWPDRQWEWASLRPENGTFDAPTYLDLTARSGSIDQLSTWGDDIINGENGIRATSQIASIFMQ